MLGSVPGSRNPADDIYEGSPETGPADVCESPAGVRQPTVLGISAQSR